MRRESPACSDHRISAPRLASTCTTTSRSGCVGVCRDLAIRLVCGRNENHDKRLSASFASNRRVRQHVMAVVDYMIAASGIPKDFSVRIQDELSSL
jgi:hypothetical protein